MQNIEAKPVTTATAEKVHAPPKANGIMASRERKSLLHQPRREHLSWDCLDDRQFNRSFLSAGQHHAHAAWTLVGRR